MAFEFDSSTPLSVKHLDLRRPLKPLVPKRDPIALESFLRPSRRHVSSLPARRKPLKSILKNRNESQNYRREPLKRLPVNYTVPGKPKFDSLLDSLKGMVGSKMFSGKWGNNESGNDLESRINRSKGHESPAAQSELKPEFKPDPIIQSKIKFQQEISKIEADHKLQVRDLEMRIQKLEEENGVLLRTNKNNLLKKEMEKQDLEIQNRLLRREIEILSKHRQSEHAASKESDFDIDFNNKHTGKVVELYKSTNVAELSPDMDEIKRKILVRRLRNDLSTPVEPDRELTSKIRQLERNVETLTAKLNSNEPIQSSDEKILDQIKDLLQQNEMMAATSKSKKRFQEDEVESQPDSRKRRSNREGYGIASLADLTLNEQLSPIRL